MHHTLKHVALRLLVTHGCSDGSTLRFDIIVDIVRVYKIH